MSQAAQITRPRRHPHYIANDALAAQITELFAYITAANHKFLMLVAEFDEKGYWQLCGVHSCAHWLNWRCGIGMNAAREKVRVARALQGLPKISKAFARGEISYSKVRAITRAANEENEDYLLMFARHGTAHHVEKLIRGFRWVNRTRKAEAEETPRDARAVTSYWDGDGYMVIKARLTTEQGAMVLKAMDLAVDRQYEAERETKDADEAPGYSAKGSQAAKETPVEKNARIAIRRADALGEMAEAYLQNEAPSGSSADRYQVMVHVAAEQASSNDTLDLPRLDKGPGVTAETSRRIGCDCSIVPIFKNIKGEPLSVGRKTRAIPPAIMRALWVRDGGCRFPGCTHTRFADGHHIKHWADGGETSLANLVLLCRHHHGLIHEGGFGCELNKHGAVVFKSPRGNVIPAAFELKAPSVVNEPVAWFKLYLDCDHVDAETCRTLWEGEQCDWSLAVGHLFANEEPYYGPAH